MLTGADGYTTTEVPGDLIIRGSLVLSDENNVDRIHFEGATGSRRRRLSTSSDGVAISLSDADGNTRTIVDSDGNFRSLDARGRTTTRMDGTGFESKDENEQVRFSARVDEGVVVSDEDGAEVVGITDEGVELRRKSSVQADSSVRSLRLTKDGVLSSFDDTGAVERVTISSEEVSVRDTAGSRVVVTDRTGIKMHEVDSTSANGRRLTSAGDVERSVSIRMTTSDGTVKTRLDTTSIKLTDDAGVEKVKLSEDAGVAVKDSDGAEVASINVDGIELKKKPSDGSSTAVRSIRLTKEGSFKSYDETGLVEKVSIDNTTVSIRDDTGAETVAITKDAVKLKKADGTEKVSIDRDDIVMKDDAGEEKMTLDKDSLSVKGDAGTETVKVDKDSITIKTDADASTQVDKVVIDRDEIKMNDATGAEVVKTTTEGIEMLEKDTVSADEERVGIKVKKSDGTIKTKLDGQAIELRREDGSALIKLSNNATSIDDNMTTPLVISSAETDSSIEFGPDLGMRVKSVNGSSRMTGESLRQYAKDKTLRLYADKEGIDIRDGNTSTAGSNKLVLSMGVAGLVTYDTAGDVSLLLKREGEIASKAAVEVNDVATLETEYTRELERYSASDRRNVADKVDEKEAEERNEDYTESVYKTVDTVDADDPRDTVDAGRG